MPRIASLGRRYAEFKRPTDGQHILFREDQLADPLPVCTQLPLLAHVGHVLARLTNGVQRATALVGSGRSRFWERYSGRNNMVGELV